MKTLAPGKVTDKQKAWLKKESKRTGEPIASIVRQAIQKAMEITR